MKRPTVRLVAATAACLVGFLVWSQFPDRPTSAPAFGDFAQAQVEARSAPSPEKQSAAPDDQSSTHKPVVVVSIAGYDQVVDDVGFIGKLAQQDQLKETIDAMIALQTNAKGLAGLDRKRPWGAVVSTDGTSFSPLAFVPVNSLQQLLDATAGIIGPVEKKENGILQIKIVDQTLYLKENNGWLFIGQSPESLADLPDDPLKSLGGLDKEYDVALRFYSHNIPELFRTMAIDQLNHFIESMPPAEDENQAAAKQRKEFQKLQTKSLADQINNIEQFTLGWALDQKASTSHLDATWIAIPGSPLAEALNTMETTSNYAGFLLPKATALFGNAQKLRGHLIDQTSRSVDQLQATLTPAIEELPALTDDDSRAAAKRVWAEACDIIQATIKTGRIDFGGSLILGDRRLTAIAGAYVSEPGKLEKVLTDLAEIARRNPKFSGIKSYVITERDIHFRTWTIPVPTDDRLNRAIGNELKFVVGFGPKSVYVGAGTDDPLPAIRQAIAASKAGATNKVSPVVGDLSLKPILDFVRLLQPDDKTIAAVLAEVTKTPDNDHIHFQMKPLQNGFSYRLELQEGALKGLALAASDRAIRDSGRVELEWQEVVPLGPGARATGKPAEGGPAARKPSAKRAATPPPNPPADRELKLVTIGKAYSQESAEAPAAVRELKWSLQPGNGRFFIHCQEWLDNAGDYLQYKQFMRQADPNLVLRAEGQPDVACRVTHNFVTNRKTNLCELEVIIPAAEYAKMVADVTYTLHPTNAKEGYEWRVRDGLTVTRATGKPAEGGPAARKPSAKRAATPPPNPPADDELKLLTIEKAYWKESDDAPKEVRELKWSLAPGSARLFIHCQEWVDNGGYYLQYKRFMLWADQNFVLQSEGQPDVACRVTGNHVANGKTNLRELEIFIPAAEYAKMTKDVAYTLHPPNAKDGYEWRVRDGLTVKRQ